MNPALNQQRAAIDELDTELHALPVSDEARESAVLNSLVQRNQGPLNAASIRRIFGTILAESRRLQHTLGAGAK